MDSDLWARLSVPSSRRQSRSDPFQLGDEIDGDEIDGDDESRPEYICPFCADDFDIVGLCCHIDEEHTIEAKNGLCPVCVKKVGMDLVGHITMQHGNLLKVQRKRRLRRGGSNSAVSLFKKELQEGKLQSLLGGSSSYALSSSNAEPDPWLSSFMYNSPAVNEPTSGQLHSSVDASSLVDNSIKDSLERSVHEQPPLSDKDQKEKAKKSEFVQGLLLSTFLDDDYL